jgi:hypothetical protein
MSAFYVSYVLLWLVVCVLVSAVAVMYSAFGAHFGSQKGRSALPPLGPSVGQTFALPIVSDLHGEEVSANTRRWIFVTPTCGACASVKEALATIEDAEDASELVVICGGAREDVAEWANGLPDWIRIADDDGAVFTAFGIQATPFYVGLDIAGACLVSGSVTTATDLVYYEQLVSGRFPRGITSARPLEPATT